MWNLKSGGRQECRISGGNELDIHFQFQDAFQAQRWIRSGREGQKGAEPRSTLVKTLNQLRTSSLRTENQGERRCNLSSIIGNKKIKVRTFLYRLSNLYLLHPVKMVLLGTSKNGSLVLLG